MEAVLKLSDLPEMVEYARIRDAYYRIPVFLRWLHIGKKRELDKARNQAQCSVMNATIEQAEKWDGIPGEMRLHQPAYTQEEWEARVREFEKSYPTIGSSND